MGGACVCVCMGSRAERATVAGCAAAAAAVRLGRSGRRPCRAPLLAPSAQRTVTEAGRLIQSGRRPRRPARFLDLAPTTFEGRVEGVRGRRKEGAQVGPAALAGPGGWQPLAARAPPSSLPPTAAAPQHARHHQPPAHLVSEAVHAHRPLAAPARDVDADGLPPRAVAAVLCGGQTGGAGASGVGCGRRAGGGPGKARCMHARVPCTRPAQQAGSAPRTAGVRRHLGGVHLAPVDAARRGGLKGHLRWGGQCQIVEAKGKPARPPAAFACAPAGRLAWLPCLGCRGPSPRSPAYLAPRQLLHRLQLPAVEAGGKQDLHVAGAHAQVRQHVARVAAVSMGEGTSRRQGRRGQEGRSRER